VPGRVVGTGGLVNPLSVREQVERAPQDRPQNVPVAITPRALVGFDYYPWSFVTNFLARYLSVWGFPWWAADAMTGYGSGIYGAGPYGQAANQGEFGALRYGMGHFGTGGYS
jgi:hypothetical protein